MTKSAHRKLPTSARAAPSGVRGVWARLKRWLGIA